MTTAIVPVAPGLDAIQAALDANAGAADLELQLSNGLYPYTLPAWVSRGSCKIRLAGGGKAVLTPNSGGQAYSGLMVGPRPTVPGDFSQLISAQPAGQQLDGGVGGKYCYRVRPGQRIQHSFNGLALRSWTQSLAAPNWDAWAGVDDFSLSVALVAHGSLAVNNRVMGLADPKDSYHPSPLLLSSSPTGWNLQLALSDGTTGLISLPTTMTSGVQVELKFQFKLSTGSVSTWLNGVPVTPTVTGLPAGKTLMPNWGAPFNFWGDADVTLLGWSWQPAATYVPGSNPARRTDGLSNDSNRTYFFGTTGNETHGSGAADSRGFVAANVPALGALGVFLDGTENDTSKSIADVILEDLTVTCANCLGQAVTAFNVARGAFTEGITLRRCRLTGGVHGFGSLPDAAETYTISIEGGLIDGSDAGLFVSGGIVQCDCEFGPGGRTQVRLYDATGKVHQRMSFIPPNQCQSYADVRFSDNPSDLTLRMAVDDEIDRTAFGFKAAVIVDQSHLGKAVLRLKNGFAIKTPGVPAVLLSGTVLNGTAAGDCVLELPAGFVPVGNAATSAIPARWAVVTGPPGPKGDKGDPGATGPPGASNVVVVGGGGASAGAGGVAGGAGGGNVVVGRP